MSSVSGKAKGRASAAGSAALLGGGGEPVIGRRPPPRGAQGFDGSSRSSTPVSVASAAGTGSRGPSMAAAATTEKMGLTTAARKKRRRFAAVDDDIIYDEDEDLAMDVDFHDSEDSRGVNSEADEEDDLDGSLDEEAASVWSEASDETSVSDAGKQKLLPRRPKSPEFIDDEDIPPLELPDTSTDLFVEGQDLMQALGVYEVMRHFSANLRMSPFRFEEFCAALCTDEQSSLLVEMHVMLIRALLREDDGNNTMFGPQDVKDSINILLYVLDQMTWYEIIRTYLESDPSAEFSLALPALDKPTYSVLTVSERLQILVSLTNLFLSTNPVREEITNEGNINYDDHCRSCHRLGDLLCCDTCPAVYHLTCLDLPEVPEDDWICSVCKLHQVKGVTDCTSEAEKSGLLCRQEPIGYDRHRRKYWFLCRRIIIEDEEDVRYLSIPLQLEELIECLDGDRYEKDLVSCLKEMKDEIVRQMTMTEDLTKENQGSRKSALEIANANLLKLRSERDNQPEEEPKKQTEEDNALLKSSCCEDVEDPAEAEGKEPPSSDDTHMAVDETKEESNQPSAATSDCETMSSMSVASKTDSVAVKAELNSEAPETKEDVAASAAYESVASNSLKQEPEDVKSNDIKQETEALKPETKDVDVRSKAAAPPSACKTIMVIGRDGGKMLMSLVRPNANGSERSVVMGSIASSSSSQESLNQGLSVLNEGRRIVTRSKTGSLTPKQFSDSVTIATTAAKTSVKTTGDESSATKDGDGLRRIRSKATLPVSAFLLSQSTYFKLGAEGSFRLYENQYSTNPLALNKNQHNEERERKRHLSHKFSLTPVSEFSWSGLTLGLSGVLLGTLRQNILQLESNIPAPFLHPNWPQHRARWTKLANAALRPEEFANVLAMLESSLKPVVFNQVWHEALGHSKLCRTPVLDREEIKKRDRKEQKKRKDEEGEELAKNTWVKYSLGLRHQVWKQKGEEYRVMGQGGWIWISTTRISRYAPASAMGLRLLAAKLQARKRKALEKEAAKETKGQEENSDGKKENGSTGCFLNETNGLMIMEDDDTTAKDKDVDEDIEVEDTVGSMQLEMENFDISRALLSRSHYSRITKPYSRLEHLLDRRLKLAEHEQKQKAIFEHIVKQYHGQKTGKKDEEPVTGARPSESGADSALPCPKTAEEASRETTSDGTAASGVGRCRCYSAICRSKDPGNTQSLNSCYSSLCRYFGAQATSNLVKELPGLGLANGSVGHAESEEDEASNNDEVCLDHEDKEDGLPFERSNDCGDNTPVYEDLMRIRNQMAEAQGVENSESTNGSKKVLFSGATKQTPRKETISSQNISAGFSDSGAVLSLMSFFHDGKLHITAEVVKQLEARLSRMDRTELPVVLTKRGPGRPSKAAPNVRSFGLLKKGAIPSVHRYLTPGKKSSLFVLRRHFLRSLARREGKCETPGFNYACKMSNVNWPYPCPRPYFKTAWEYRTMMMRNIPAVATQLRVLWACIRWDDLSTKVPPSGTNTITTETDITTTKLLKRRDVGPFGSRSEFLVRKIVIPISVPSQPREKYTPQRSGLRERRRPESPKLKEPSVTECWVPEEQLELWEIKLFGDRIEKQNRLAMEKSQQQQQRQSGGEGSLDKGTLDEQLKNQRQTTAAAAGVKRTADGQLKTPDSGVGLKSVSSLISSSASNLRVIQVQQPAQRSLLANAASGSLLSTPTASASASDGGQTVQNLRIVHGPNGQLQVQGLLPGQQIIRLPNGQLHLVTATSKTSQQQQPQAKSTSVLLSSHVAQSKSEASVSSGGTNVSTSSPSAPDVVSSSVTSGSRTPSQVAVIGGQRIVLTGGSIVSQAAVGGSALKPGQSLSKFVVVPSGSLALSGQKQPLLVTGGGGGSVTPKLVKLPLQLQQSQQPGKVMLSSGQVISGQPTIVRTATGQHFIIHSGATAQETPTSGTVLAAQHGASPPDSVSAVGATQSLLTSPNSLTSSVNLSTSPSAASPTKYTVTPQVLQQVVNQALMQTQDPEITAKLLMMQKVMQQQTAGSGAAVSCNQQLQLKQQLPVKASGASVRHQKGLTQELKDEQARLSDCSQVMRGIFDNVEKCEKQELKRQRKHETADEKVKRIFLHKLEGQLTKRKETLKKEILRKRNILEKTISAKIQSEITQVVEARHSRRIVHAKKGRPDYAIRMDLGPLTISTPISAVSTPPVACELEVKEPKSKRRKQKVVTAGNATRQISGSTGNSDDKLYCLCKTPYDESKFYIGCDRCEDWFHGSCVGVTKSEADRMDTYVCPSCRTTSGDSATNQTRLQDQHQVELRRLLNVIKVHRMSWPFREPVCPKEVPDYYTVIKEPMDLSTIEKKLLSHQYSTLGEFVKDITKIFDNCRYYNPSSSPFYRCAEALEVYFVEKLKALKEKLKL